MAQRPSTGSLEEARAYFAHSFLGARLRECVEALQGLTCRSATDVFGNVDALKLRSSLTLFTLAESGPIFGAALARWFGSMDERTADLLSLQLVGPVRDRLVSVTPLGDWTFFAILRMAKRDETALVLIPKSEAQGR